MCRNLKGIVSHIQMTDAVKRIAANSSLPCQLYWLFSFSSIPFRTYDIPTLTEYSHKVWLKHYFARVLIVEVFIHKVDNPIVLHGI